MPRVVNYADRFDAVREAVYALTLREGPASISLSAVARESSLSPRTLQRLVSSTDVLPHLGLQWAERAWRHRCLARDRLRTDRELDAGALLVRDLLECLPGALDEPDDRRAWWALVTTFEGSQEWAQAARTEHVLTVEGLVATILTEAGSADADHEGQRLCALVEGLAHRILARRISHADASTLLRRHVSGLHPQGQEDDAA